jgi:hypothetical protein
MSSSVYIPSTSGGGGSFTPPASISVKTASYTIPAGRYARVYTECDSGGIFTINAVNAVVTAAFVNIDLQGTTSNFAYTAPSGFYAKVTAAAGGGTTFSVNGNVSQALTGTAYSSQFEIGPSGTMAVPSTFLSSGFIQGVAIPSNATNRQATFYVPTGTVISGSGNWKAIVEEYTV